MIEYKFREYSVKEYVEYLRLALKITEQMATDFQLNLDDFRGFFKMLPTYESILNRLDQGEKFLVFDDSKPFEKRKKAFDYENEHGLFSNSQKGPFGENLVNYVDATFERELLQIKNKFTILRTDTESNITIGSKEFLPYAKQALENATISNDILIYFRKNFTLPSPYFDEAFRIFSSYKEYTNSPLKEEFKIAIDQIREISNYLDEIEINKSDFYPSIALIKQPENSIKNIIKDRIESRDIKRNESDSLLYPEVIQYYTLLETDKILLERGMRDYSMYQVSRSNHKGIDTGSYFYSFDVDDNLLMTKFPFQQVELEEGTYIMFDAELYRSGEVIVIPKEEIVSFKLYGTELMQSSVTTNSKSMVMDASNNMDSATYNRPSIVGTFFSSMLFGSAYTILNGVGKQMYQQTNVLGNKLDGLSDQITQVVEAINNISITTDHQIIDTSRVQIILTNKRDLEIDGISIYYDLNRVYPNLDNPSSQSVPKLEEKATHSTNMADEVLKLKALLDQGIIDEEEFKAMKKKLIN